MKATIFILGLLTFSFSALADHEYLNTTFKIHRSMFSPTRTQSYVALTTVTTINDSSVNPKVHHQEIITYPQMADARIEIINDKRGYWKDELGTTESVVNFNSAKDSIIISAISLEKARSTYTTKAFENMVQKRFFGLTQINAKANVKYSDLSCLKTDDHLECDETISINIYSN